MTKKYTTYKLTNIEWDVDDLDDLEELPTECSIKVPNEIIDEHTEADYLVDTLTDTFGFCVKSVSFE